MWQLMHYCKYIQQYLLFVSDKEFSIESPELSSTPKVSVTAKGPAQEETLNPENSPSKEKTHRNSKSVT